MKTVIGSLSAIGSPQRVVKLVTDLVGAVSFPQSAVRAIQRPLKDGKCLVAAVCSPRVCEGF